MSKKSGSVRAVRNNNPGNIERSTRRKRPDGSVEEVITPWQGLMPVAEMSDEQRDERRFAVFKSPAWGFRALAVTLITYQDKRRAADGSVIDTVAEAVARWAPSNENDTSAYVRHVCQLTGFQPNQVLDFHRYEEVAPLSKGIATHECGGWFFDDADLEEGMRLAGVRPPAKALTKSRTVKAATAGAVATGVSVAAEIIQQAAPATSFIREVAEFAPEVAGAIVVAFLGYIVWVRYDDWRRSKR